MQQEQKIKELKVPFKISEQNTEKLHTFIINEKDHTVFQHIACYRYKTTC